MHPVLALPTFSPSFALNLPPYKYLPRWDMLDASPRESNKATGGLSVTQAPSSLPVGWFRLLEAACLFQNKASAGKNGQERAAPRGSIGTGTCLHLLNAKGQLERMPGGGENISLLLFAIRHAPAGRELQNHPKTPHQAPTELKTPLHPPARSSSGRKCWVMRT